MRNPIDNLTYDWIAVLHSKAQGIEAYDKYLKDARDANSQQCVDLLEELRDQDAKSLEKIRQHVSSVLQDRSSANRDSSAKSAEAARAAH